eukprot:TRINITY_DN13171_c0_g1_i1.p2 TRINITY_DN13171_c0_g1~~TRINITY_DN13171_c0_g1_i1.p2  ORF type:complete len:448 (-),score=103.97 TRINITY_DN13171_c0_g1_i1:1189-2508(-)
MAGALLYGVLMLFVVGAHTHRIPPASPATSVESQVNALQREIRTVVAAIDEAEKDEKMDLQAAVDHTPHEFVVRHVVAREEQGDQVVQLSDEEKTHLAELRFTNTLEEGQPLRCTRGEGNTFTIEGPPSAYIPFTRRMHTFKHLEEQMDLGPATQIVFRAEMMPSGAWSCDTLIQEVLDRDVEVNPEPERAALQEEAPASAVQPPALQPPAAQAPPTLQPNEQAKPPPVVLGLRPENVPEGLRVAEVQQQQQQQQQKEVMHAEVDPGPDPDPSANIPTPDMMTPEALANTEDAHVTGAPIAGQLPLGGSAHTTPPSEGLPSPSSYRWEVHGVVENMGSPKGVDVISLTSADNAYKADVNFAQQPQGTFSWGCFVELTMGSDGKAAHVFHWNRRLDEATEFQNLLQSYREAQALPANADKKVYFEALKGQAGWVCQTSLQ